MRLERPPRLTAAIAAGAVALGAIAVPALAPIPASANGPAVQAASTTSTALKSSRPEARYGDAGQITATVKGPGRASGVPTGEVEFGVDGESFSTAAVGPTGKAVLPLADLYPSLGVGPHTVVANYLGDGNFAPSSSAPITQTLIGRTSEASSNLTLNEKGAPVFSPASFSLRYQDPFSCNVLVHNGTPNGYQVLYGTPGNWKALRYVIPAGGTGNVGAGLENSTAYFTVRGAANYIRIHCA